MRRSISAPNAPCERKPKAALSHTVSRGKLLPFWSTKPLPPEWLEQCFAGSSRWPFHSVVPAWDTRSLSASPKRKQRLGSMQIFRSSLQYGRLHYLLG